jgi:hypothetical protein
MQSFTDKNGNTWDLELNIGAAMRLKSRLKFDLDKIISPDPENNNKTPLETISEDSILLFNIIFILCEKKLESRNLNQEQFAELFDADTIQKATDALLDEIINFSRPAIRKILLQLKQISKEYSDEAGKELDRIINSPEFKNEVKAKIKAEIENPSGN